MLHFISMQFIFSGFILFDNPAWLKYLEYALIKYQNIISTLNIYIINIIKKKFK